MSTNKDIIVQLKDSTILSMIERCKDSSERGFLYEALWNIVVKFNCLPNIKISKHIKSNLNKKTKVVLSDFSNDFLLKPFRSGNSGGYSDITFKDSSENLYISSVKYFENDSGKHRDDWDLPKLAALTKIHGNAKIIVFTKNKNTFLSTYQNSNRNDIHNVDLVYDFEDLNNSITHVVNIISKYNWNFDLLLQHYFGKQKSQLKLMFHQELCLLKTSKMSAYEPMLWGLKCRSGKSYIMAGHIHQNRFSNILIITPIPNESIKSLTSLFQQHIEFDEYTVIHLQRGSKIPTSDNKIIIASKQYLDNKEISSLKEITFDAVYSDENHWGGTTENSKDIVKKYVKQGRTQFVTLTATYLKSKTEWNISHEQSFFWDLEDEMLCKTANVESLKEKYGDDVDSMLDHHDLLKEYAEMPILTLLSVTHDPMFVSKFKQFNTDDSYSFDTTNLLKCVDGDFISTHKTCVQDLVDYHFGDGINNGKNMMDRIKKYDTRTGSQFHTQLWFLPYGSGNNLNETAKSLKALIEFHKYGKKFAVEILTSENDNSEKGSLYEYIQSLENRAIEESKRGLVLLLGFKCSMGISLPLADVVVLLNNGESMDMYMQMMMRSMTESRGTNKKRGFVIDYNQKRVLQTSLNMVRSGTMSIRENIEKSLNIVHVDEDMAVRDKTSVIDKIYDIWKNAKINRIDLIRKKLEQLPSVEFDKDDYKKINGYMKDAVIQKEKSKKEKETVEVNSDDEKLSDGASVGSAVSKNDLSHEEEAEVKIDYGKELLTSIPILSGLLTHKQKSTTDILQCLELIQADEYLQSIFINQCEVWWGIKNSIGFIELLKYLINKYYLDIIRSINICVENMKESIESLLDNKKELLDLINSMLKPKDVEKEKFGEVFTPLELVEEMLGHLPTGIWTNPNLKWFDPTVGVGNFMVCIYYRLMEGLRDIIKDDCTRKNHIITNMLFMSELNSKNVFVCKTIFGEKCNLHEGNTLLLDVSSKWNISKFDIIVGNPPYNSGGIRSSTGKKLGEKNETIWPKFVEQAFSVLKEGGYLVFIHPLSWLKTSHSQHNALMQKHIEWLMLWDDSKSKSIISADIPLSIYVIHNIINSNKLNTNVVSKLMRQRVNTNSTVCLDMNYSIPFAYHSIFEKIIRKIESNPKLKLEINTSTVKSEGKSYKLPENYSKEDMLGIDTYRVKDGYFVKKIKEQHKDTTKRKLIIANKSSFVGSIIDDGRLGLVGTDKAYILGESLELIQKLLSTKIANVIAHNTRYRQHFLDKEAFTYLIDVRNIPTSELPYVTDECLYKYLELTKEEIDMIEKS